MNGNEIIQLGLGIIEPWKITGQILDTSKQPNELRLTLQADRGTKFPCPVCGKLCKVHDFKKMTWRHLNFFQHHCSITASVPRTKCSEHGVKRITVPWARKGSKFTLLFEQAALVLVKEMPVLAAARIMEITDKRLWRIVLHYVNTALKQFDLSKLQAFSLDETKGRRGHRYITIFIDLDRKENPVVFATPGKGKKTLSQFKEFLENKGGAAENVVEVVADMSSAFIAGIKEHFTKSRITVDWFHVVQLLTKALEKVRRAESKEATMHRGTRWAILKKSEGEFTEKQLDALAELTALDLHTATAWRVKELLRWVRRADSVRGAKWRLTWFLHVARELVEGIDLLAPVRTALNTIEKHRHAIESRWISGHSNARIEALNGIFQAAKARARGFRKDETFISMIYLLASPVQDILEST
jgi:transposase